MAKKKAEASGTTQSSKPKAAKKPATSPATKSAESKQTKSGKQPSAGKSGATTTPMVDTSFAAQAAARMLMGRRDRTETEQDKKGSLVQQVKADLNKGHAATVSGVLDKNATSSGQRRPDLPFHQKQTGRNQTSGPDVTRTGVPRRTSG